MYVKFCCDRKQVVIAWGWGRGGDGLWRGTRIFRCDVSVLYLDCGVGHMDVKSGDC